ncbi:fatty acid CoA ligase family protein [Streptomyces fulvorobeus]|uniref:Acyl-coenzyme A synthetase/AMP-(Fatty) acid ligase n=1 Tax=Streptomyces fulvorobeus TaxID=284028 RepID=A0A7Y9KVB4_9ACTN|nr:fatty acid CoA ligase family protein [Streptomyces fulvorobeus]NYE40634.1 acyl-coenzyme A synthetase/AMP-(fatty) acid ligase [Streptomyces fulvorobeus]
MSPVTAVPELLEAFAEQARNRPTAPVLHRPARRGGHTATTYAELRAQVQLTAPALTTAGVIPGTRVVVMVRDGLEFLTDVYALILLGAVPVLIDPGLPHDAVRGCLEEIAPQAFIGQPKAHAARTVLGWARHTATLCLSTASRPWGPWPRLNDLRRGAHDSPVPAPTRVADDALAFIAFTSGSTGEPKGVQYTYRQLGQQAHHVGDAFGIRAGAPVLSAFLPFTLYLPALGAHTVLPVFDPRRPADTDPRSIIQAIQHFQARALFGSPALLHNLARHCSAHGLRLDGLLDIATFGAPLTPVVLDLLDRCVPAACRIRSVYGATECLPASIADRDDLRGARTDPPAPGTPVGVPVPRLTVRIIAPDLPATGLLADAPALEPGAIGEITVSGPHVSRAYFGQPRANAQAKIKDGQRTVHRTGDLGWLDDKGRLFYCGRKAHAVHTTGGTLYTEQIEAPCNSLPGIARTALVGVGSPGRQRAVLCIELERSGNRHHTADLEQRVRQRLHGLPGGELIEHLLIHPGFPVDIRHNAKIERGKLARWAARALPAPRTARAAATATEDRP